MTVHCTVIIADKAEIRPVPRQAQGLMRFNVVDLVHREVRKSTFRCHCNQYSLPKLGWNWWR